MKEPSTVDSAGLTADEEFPIHRVRFRGGRVFHRARRPADWDDLLEAACGRTGYRARGYPNGPISHCRGCAKVIAEDHTPQAASASPPS